MSAFLLKLLIKWVVVSGLFLGIALFAPAVKVTSKKGVAIAAAVFGLANLTLGWLLGFLLSGVIFIPNLLTLGLLGLLVPVVVNLIILKMVDVKYEAIDIDTVPPLVGIATVISVAAFAVEKLM